MYRILLADSDAEVRLALKENMEESGRFRVDEAADETTAAALLRSEKYDAVIADAHFPSGGLNLLDSLKDEPFVPVRIFMSVGETFDDVRAAMRSGAEDYLVKPLSQKEMVWLKERLMELTERRRRRLAREEKREGLLEKARELLLEQFPETEEEFGFAGNREMQERWGKSSVYIGKARKLIAQRINAGDGTVSVKTLACELGLSSNYFGKIFREGTGISLSDYVNHMRIRRAVELLRTTELKIYEVGRAVGYENQHYFSVAFKRVTGVSPSEFREILQ